MSTLRVLIIGAHPDDPDVTAGATAALYARAGHTVKFLTVTNGDTGHHEIGGIELARRRRAEAQASAGTAGISEYQILDNHCGELEPTIAIRKTIIRIIREFRPDLIITHRPYDYHPDHRYTSQLVMDASYIVTVPNMVALTDIVDAPLRICYMYDRFTKPYPFQADIVVDITSAMATKSDMMHCHTSQMYEWIPFNRGILDQVPAGEGERQRWLDGQRLPANEEIANKYRERLVDLYGSERGAKIRYAEAFEACEYGSGLDEEEMKRLFPFFD